MVRAGTFFNPTFGGQFRGVYPEGPELDRLDVDLLDRHARELGSVLGPVKERLLPFFTRLRFHQVDPAQRKDLEAGMENVAELMRQFTKAGGRMVAGTDTSRIGLPGARLHRELQFWVTRGISPMHALQGATLHPAELFRRADIGILAAGKAADLVVLEANPLSDIRNIGRIVTVIKDGRPIARKLRAATYAPLVSTAAR